MELNKFVETLDKSQRLAIGAKLAFVFIGTVSEWFQDMEKVNDYELNRATKMLKYLKLRYNIDSRCNVGDEKKRRKRLLKYWKGRVDAFKPFQNREIIERYVSKYDGRISILVEGEENGDFHTENEYKGISEEDVYKEFVRKRYKVDGKKVVAVNPVIDDSYERLRDEIIKAPAKMLKNSYAYFLKNPNQRAEVDYKICEHWFLTEAFEYLSPGINGYDLVNSIKRFIDKQQGFKHE